MMRQRMVVHHYRSATGYFVAGTIAHDIELGMYQGAFNKRKGVVCISVQLWRESL